MGKASSAKKVARAARAGGTTSGTRKNIAFPAALVVLAVLGVGLVVFARSTNPGDGDPQLGDHWHAAYGIYVCDRWVANVPDRGADSLGIHTHDDGVVHIHPFLSGATGDKATLGKFFEQTGIEVGDSSITLPPSDAGLDFDSRKYVNGETTCGGEEARVVSAYWADAATANDSDPDDVRTSNISGEPFEANGGAYTIAFLPKGADIPPPPTAAQLQELGAADGAPDQPIEQVPTDNELPEGAGTPGDPNPDTETVLPPDGGELPVDPPVESTEVPATSEAPAGG
ncbi:MAG: hypothetical protein ACR2JF_18935 [Iamia sp.]